jgi:hypothetical protein
VKDYFDLCISEAYETACEKGWHEGDVYPLRDRTAIAAKLALVHAELTEAYDEWNTDPRRGVTYSVTVELADVAIRLFDLMGAMGLQLPHNMSLDTAMKPDFPALLLDLHAHTSDVVEHLRKPDSVFPDVVHWKMAVLLHRMFALCANMGIDLRKAVGDKMQKNRLRPHRHGGKLL